SSSLSWSPWCPSPLPGSGRPTLTRLLRPPRRLLLGRFCFLVFSLFRGGLLVFGRRLLVGRRLFGVGRRLCLGPGGGLRFLALPLGCGLFVFGHLVFGHLVVRRRFGGLCLLPLSIGRGAPLLRLDLRLGLGFLRGGLGDLDLALDSLFGDDDGVGEALGAPAGLAEELICLRAAGLRLRDLVELLLYLLGRGLSALHAIAGLHDLLDVELEDVPPPELALRPAPPPQEHAEPAAAFTQRERDLLADLVVVGDRLLGLARERHPHRGHVDEDHHRALGERAAG